MGQPVYFGGTIPLKPGTKPAQIISIYNDETGSDLTPEDLVPAHFDPDRTLAIGDGGDEIQLFFSIDQVEYSVDTSNISYDFADNFANFLNLVGTSYAASGWSSYEGHEPEQVIIEYGPNPTATAFRTVERLVETITHHQAELTKALVNLQKEIIPAPA